MAQHITMTIAQSFNVAYEQWQSSSIEAESCPPKYSEMIVGSTDSAGSIGTMGSSVCDDTEISDWASFDDFSTHSQVNKLTSHLNSMNLVQIPLQPLQPSLAPPQKSGTSRRNDHLLICIN